VFAFQGLGLWQLLNLWLQELRQMWRLLSDFLKHWWHWWHLLLLAMVQALRSRLLQLQLALDPVWPHHLELERRADQVRGQVQESASELQRRPASCRLAVAPDQVLASASASAPVPASLL
jgi:hypothetical protein